MPLFDLSTLVRAKKTGRIAVFVAGDHNIFFPALVALDSIQKNNNKHPFDYYMSFSSEHLTDRMKQILAAHDITFLDVDEFDTHGSVSGLSAMHENRWPEEIFYNWIAPLYFAAQGYEYALKVDYDILCLAEYELPKLTNPASTFTGLAWDLDLTKQGLTKSHLDALDIPDFTAERVAYFNAGFVAINLNRYVEQDTYNKFKTIYALLQSQETAVNMAEQVALSITAYLDPSPVARLDETYNTRITVLPQLSPDKQPIIRNIHYITQNKPWRAVDFRYLEGYTKSDKTCLYMYRNAWLKYAADIDGFSEFIEISPPSELETIGMYSQIFASHYRLAKTANKA
ncbi:glycosyltransferase [Arthrobacter sunyaminii]|uniref:Uncharacterized protein n=1 Tax=Arthrobacter sunyaminii TaxID=2816859 RepID=A0A975S578_9MICC|nr:glycosyltransferase [Arthrobacter sunyaminii]MBO0896018.1 hypothetical protein [Arthrobacter sunyaminii]MBO0907693.1 hypothetical protein [Arthrobacter sunyaminii]QWQ35249.1 hypothetical protein KG104_12165 [Arthrobacter sunyaminii]